MRVKNNRMKLKIKKLMGQVLNLDQAHKSKFVKNSGIFKLGDWLVNPNLDRISQGDHHVSLQPQVMDLLVFLANHHDEVISSDELLSKLWKDRIVTNSSVYSGLKQLRAALGDDVHNPTYIKTIPKRGYRLSAKPEFLDVDGETSSPGQSGGTRPHIAQGKRSRLNAVLLMAAFVITLSATFYYQNQDRAQGSDQAMVDGDKSIAVLPFVDMSPGQDRAWFSDGMAEEILNKLAQLPDLKVTGRQSSFSFRQSESDLKTIGKVLGVAHLLEGSVRYDKGRVRVTAQLIRASDGFHIWSQEYDREAADSIAIQDDISSNIAAALALELGAKIVSESTMVSTAIYPDFSAYELYLQSLALIDQSTKRSLMSAIVKLEKALKLEPDYAEAHVALARVYLDMVAFSNYYQEDTFGESRALARPHAERALAINPNLAEAHAVLGDLSMRYDESQKYFEKALSLNPNLFWVHMELGISVMDQLRPWSDTLVHLERAREIEPLSIEAATTMILFLQWFPHRWEEAESIIANLLQLYPDSLDVKQAQASWLLFVRGRPSEAVPLLQQVITIDPDNYWARRFLIRAWYKLGETERALEFPGTSAHWGYVLGPDREASLKSMREAPENNAEIDYGRRLIFAYTYIMLRDWQSAVDLLAAASEDLEAFSRSKYVQNFAQNESAAMSLAVAYKKLGDLENFEKFAEFEKNAVNIRTENGKHHNEQYSRAMARLNALEGRNYEAMLELEHLIITGSIDPREFLHPAFDEMRSDPAFKRLENLQRERINSERNKMGLAPLTLNEPVAQATQR
jgi:TolB-like protein/DNA-binding winged helix-turn-helix (wHTH) protein